MSEKNLEEFLSEKEKELPYISHNLSPMPFEQPSFTVKILLEYFFQPADLLNSCNEIFPVDLFGKDFPISFSVVSINDEKNRINKKLIIEIHHFFSYNEKMQEDLKQRIKKIITQIETAKRFKGSFMYQRDSSTLSSNRLK